jgi:hypothetical protein
MKLTNKQLRKIVNEEVKRLHEGRFESLLARSSRELRDIDISVLLAFAKAYADLGDAVGEQAFDIINDSNAECNSNAIRMIRDELGGCNAELDDAIAAWEENNGKRSEDFDEDEPAPEDDEESPGR